MEKLGNKKTLIQLIKFACVGVLNSVINEGVYAILTYVGMHYIPAYFIGFSLSVLNAYYWNNKYVFKASADGEKRVWWKVLGKTYLAYTTGLVLSLVLLWVWMDVVKIERFFIPLGNFLVGKGFEGADADFLAGICASLVDIVLILPLNFIINKLWAFSQKKKKSESVSNE